MYHVVYPYSRLANSCAKEVESKISYKVWNHTRAMMIVGMTDISIQVNEGINKCGR